MAEETVRLAEYAAGLRYGDLPAEIVRRAKDCIADTVAACICGASMPWSRIVIDYARRTGAGGTCRILGSPGPAAQAPAAALANGASAHAFELDSLTRPGAGAHPGATVLPPALAMAQQEGRDGKALIAAFVAGNEVMIRIGRASLHSNEGRGFHAPGTTGPFGAAVAAGHILGLEPKAMTNALGIAGSLAGGLLEFARGDGGTVKRLHLGRASEAGVLAASLAAAGFAGPRTVIEGEFGFLRVFCASSDEAQLTQGLGSDFAVATTVLKRYPCHATAHAAVKAARLLQAAHGFAAGEIERITVSASARMRERHDIREPADLMLAQYSIPFSVALALCREARDPESWDETILADREIRALARRVELVPEAAGGAGSKVTVKTTDGRSFERREADGMLEAGELADKFGRLTRAGLGEAESATLYARLQRLEEEARLDWLAGLGDR